jgi:intein/homing endonuclease
MLFKLILESPAKVRHSVDLVVREAVVLARLLYHRGNRRQVQVAYSRKKRVLQMVRECGGATSVAVKPEKGVKLHRLAPQRIASSRLRSPPIGVCLWLRNSGVPSVLSEEKHPKVPNEALHKNCERYKDWVRYNDWEML